MVEELEKARPKKIYQELGTSGLSRWDTKISEEFLPELRGERGRATLHQMGDCDPTLSAILYVYKSLMRACTWEVRSSPLDSSPLSKKATEFVDECINDLSISWDSTAANFTSFLQYGFSVHEPVFKQRLGPDAKVPSSFDDGMIGLRKIPGRSQRTITDWAFDKNGGIRGCWQEDARNNKNIFLPIEKLLLFRTQENYNNPEGKALALDTILPTPDGWRTIEDINPGDRIFSDSGDIANVVAVKSWGNRPRIMLEFSDGSKIVADENHEWLTQTAKERYEDRSGKIRTTKDIYETLKASTGTSNHTINLSSPLRYVKQSLLVDPYILGLWLGDGDSRNSVITSHYDDIGHIEKYLDSLGLNYSTTDSDISNSCRVKIYDDIQKKLSVLGVLMNKHIPWQYLMSDINDRHALLEGLMDSDGYIDGFGRCEFVNTNKGLCEGVAELARSLGMTCKMSLRRNANVEKHCKAAWCVKMTVVDPVFKLQRKFDRTKMARSRNKHYITNAYYVDSGETKCIEVDSKSHMYLVGESCIKTHNSILASSYLPWYFIRQYREIQGIGAERDISGIPVIYLPAEMFTNSEFATELQQYKDLVSNIRMDEMSGVLLPHDPNNEKMFELSLLASPGKKSFDLEKIIDNLKLEMTSATLTDLMFLGHSASGGSYALSRTKQESLNIAVFGFLSSEASVINRHLIPKLLKVNPEFSKLKHYPEIYPKMKRLPNYAELSELLRSLAFSSFHVSAKPEILNSVLENYGLPLLSIEEYDELASNTTDHKILPGGGKYLSDNEESEDGADFGGADSLSIDPKEE